MSSGVWPGSDASRSANLKRLPTPASDVSLGKSTASSTADDPEIRRRGGTPDVDGARPMLESHGNPMEELLKAPITVKCHPPNLLAKPCALLPVMLLPREHVLLSFLDLSGPHEGLPAARNYESHIRILELEGRLGSNVLIAHTRSNKHVYAIEREHSGLYVVCKLGSWVNLHTLGKSATVVCPPRMRRFAPDVTGANVSEVPLTTPHMHKESKRKRLAIEELQSLVRKKPRSQSVVGSSNGNSGGGLNQLPTPIDTMPQPLCSEAATRPEQSSEIQPPSRSSLAAIVASPTVILPCDTFPEPPTGHEILENLRTQYFEALYHSMGSLAYFAKGPLSRARAAFHLDFDSDLEMSDLIDFLKDMVMTLHLLDKKYRDTVPNVVAQMKFLVESSDDEPKRKRGRAKKMRLGKDGLYPTEGDHVRRWWKANKPEPRDDEVIPRPEDVKYRIGCLRTRETQLQMILILEIIALETLRPAGGAQESQFPGLESKTPSKQAGAENSKKRRKQDLSVLVDLHADRLCIWQSTTPDDIMAMAESQAKDGGENTLHPSSDPLKDFCVDIIIPFFSPRMPHLCDTLSRKLGGPAMISPPKLKDKKQPVSKSKQTNKSGAVARRPATLKTAKSLDELLSNERRRSISRGPSNVLAQLRSVTVSTVPKIKREGSETPSLRGIPGCDYGTLKERPANVMSRGSSAGRTQDQRARKKALVEAELHDAISALKKPNRGLAGKVLVEETERRLFGGPTYIQKLKKPAQNPMDKVQVKATPMNNRFRDALVGVARAPAGSDRRPADDADCIPSSAPRRANMGPPPSSRVACTPFADRIAATPARASAVPGRLLPPSDRTDVVLASSPLGPKRAGSSATAVTTLAPVAENFVLGSSPLQPRMSAAVMQPVLPRSPRDGGAANSTISRTLFRTPLKAKAKAKAEVTPERPRQTAPAQGTGKPLSIYQQLGWDEADDL